MKLGLGLGMSSGGYSRDQISVPSGLPALPLTLQGVAGPGRVIFTPSDAITAALASTSATVIAGTIYISATGSDALGDGSIGNPFATWSKAARTRNTVSQPSRIAMLSDMTFASGDIALRNTDASQATADGNVFKYLDTNGFTALVVDSGPDLTAQTYAPDATFSSWQKATLAVVSSQQPTRVLRTDQLDDYGYSKGLYKQTTAPASNTNPSADGRPSYYWDNTGKVLWIHPGAETIAALKPSLKGIYFNSGGTSRIFIIGAAMGLKGVQMEGVQLVSIDGGSRRPEFWLHNCRQLWAPGKGCDATNGGYYIATNHICHSSEQDGANLFAKSATGKGLMQTANSRYTRSGDRDVFAIDGSIQGLSAHGGNHHASFGTYCAENNGQGFADTCTASEVDVSWLAACTTKGGKTTAANYEFGSAGASASRTAYLHTCLSLSPTGNDATIGTNGAIFTHNTSLPVITGGSVTNY